MKNDSMVLKLVENRKTWKGKVYIQYSTTIEVNGQKFVISINQTDKGIAVPIPNSEGNKHVVYGRVTKLDMSGNSMRSYNKRF